MDSTERETMDSTERETMDLDGERDYGSRRREKKDHDGRKEGDDKLKIRSYKEKRSAYDGVYRIEKCWLKVGVQGSCKVYCYLFVRCDNKLAPWTNDEHGDRSRPLPKLEDAIDMFERNETPSWNFDCHWISDFELWIIHCDLGKRKRG
ncbi:hypothetical protein Bca4012_005071 [Brassica carinata]